jgi:hypothetical protein
VKATLKRREIHTKGTNMNANKSNTVSLSDAELDNVAGGVFTPVNQAYRILSGYYDEWALTVSLAARAEEERQRGRGE